MKYIVHIGPGSDMNGGMKTVIETIINSPLKNKYHFIWIPTASLKNKKRCFINGLKQLINLCMSNRIDIAHIHMSENGSCYRTIIFILLFKIFKKRIIIHSHGSEFEVFYYHLNKLKKFIFDYLVSKVDKIIVLTNGWKIFWSDIVSVNQIVIIPNSVKVSEIKKVYNNSSPLKVVFLGEIGNRKGIYDLIKAIKIIKDRNIDIYLYIGGKGEIEKCKKLINDCNLEKNVFIQGWLSQLEKDKLLNKSDILILPSYYESFGIVLLESMSKKILTICSNGGYMKEIITNQKDGIVIETGNIHQIAEEIVNIHYNRNLLKKYGESGYMTVLNNYSEEIVLKKLDNLYLELLEK